MEYLLTCAVYWFLKKILTNAVTLIKAASFSLRDSQAQSETQLTNEHQESTDATNWLLVSQ